MIRTRHIGFALLIAGVPYVFTTGPMPLRARAALSTDEAAARPWWFYDASTMEVAGGFLETPPSFSEGAKPIDGDLDVDALTFRLHDAPRNGRSLLTWLATRVVDEVTSSPLAASITSTATTCTVGSGAVFSADSYAWIERECVFITDVTGNVLTILRHQLGTRAVAHSIVSAANVFPMVFRDVPWITRRKVTLWAIRPDGTPDALWAGLATRAPRLAADGARFDLPCDPLWNVLRENPVGATVSSAELVGYGRTGRSGLTSSGDSLLRATFQYLDGGGALHTLNPVVQGAFRDWPSLARAFGDAVEAQGATVSQIVRVTSRRNGTNATFQYTFPTPGWASRQAFLGRSFVGSALGSSATAAVVDVDQVPRTGYIVGNGTTTTWCISSLEGLPSSWAAEVSRPTDPFPTTRVVGLRVAASKDLFIGLQGITPDISSGARVTGTARFYPRTFGYQPPDLVTVTDPPALQVYREVSTRHWICGLRYGVVDLLADSDGADDFDWSETDTVTNLTAGLNVARNWLFDGRRTFGSVAVECCQLFGCSPVIRAGRVAIIPWRWPDAGETPAATYTRRDLIGMPTWATWDEGIANRLLVKSESLTLDATIADSLARYGPGRRVETTLAGVEDERNVVDDPIAFSRAVLARMDLWSEPLAMVTWRVPFTVEDVSATELGKLTQLSEWMLPNGRGDRGLAGARCLVVRRTVTLGDREAQIEVTGLVFPRVSYGYAPCIRIAGRHAGSSTVFEVATEYVGGTTSYADTEHAGAEHFHHADGVEFILRDNTADIRESAVVFAVNLITPPTIEFDSPPSSTMLAHIDEGGIVDLRLDHFSATALEQRGWMFVGSETSSTIDRTDTPARRIAP